MSLDSLIPILHPPMFIGGQWWEPASSEELLAKGFDFFSP